MCLGCLRSPVNTALKLVKFEFIKKNNNLVMQRIMAPDVKEL